MYLEQKNIKIGISTVENSGYGVFADENILTGELVCECPLLRSATRRADYYFAFDGKEQVALGFGSLFNHSDTPNCKWEKENDLLKIIAIKDISKQEEMFFDYGKDYNYKEYFK